MPDTIHLHPTAELADRVLLPGDPGRALRLAETLLERPRMFNHHRGLWGYTGTAADGGELSIQSTGMGGPSAAIVISELHELGARVLVRVGTCGALDPELELGGLVVACEALAADGTSRALGAGARTAGSPELAARLRAAAGPETAAGLVVSSDLFYDERAGIEERWRSQGALAVEMETATLYALAGRHGFAAGAVLIVSDLLTPARQRLDPDALVLAEHRLGAVAARALARGEATEGALGA